MGDPVASLRAFIAIELTEPVREALGRAQASLRRLPARVSWTAPENLHLTLVFLGDIPAEQIAAIGAILDEVCAESPGFVFPVTGLGTFGSARQPRVVWAGMPDPPPALMALQQGLQNRLGAAGFALENKPFRPHLTLGRPRGPEGVRQLTSAIASANNTEFGEVPVRRVVLVQSRLDAGGPRYTIIRESGLKGS